MITVKEDFINVSIVGVGNVGTQFAVYNLINEFERYASKRCVYPKRYEVFAI